jgi:hypothetical protein
VRTLIVPLAAAEDTGSSAVLIAVAGFAMILATAWTIYVVVRRRPSAPASPTVDTTAVEEPDAATT